MDTLMLTRKCTKCGTTKSLDQFYQKSTKHKDGSPKYQGRCKQCMRGKALARYHDLAKRSKGSKVPSQPQPLLTSTKPLLTSNRPLTRLPQRAPFRPPTKPSKPPTERRYVVDEYSQIDPNSDD